MPFVFKIAADVLVILHAGIALFIGFGLICTLIGAWRRWRWVRNFWFRAVHLAAILAVVAESWLDVVCPLTTWEKQLRESGGGVAYEGDFIAYWVNEWLYFDLPRWVFTAFYTLFALAVLATFLCIPPRWPARKSLPPETENPARQKSA